MWPFSFGGFLRGAALCSPSLVVGEVGPLCPALGLRSDAATLARTLGGSLVRVLLVWAVAAHGPMDLPARRARRCCIWLFCVTGPGSWGGPRLVGRAPPEGPRGIGDLPPPSNSWGTSPLKPEPCNPLQRLWGGPSPSPPRAMGKGASRETSRKLPSAQPQPRFFPQDLLVW